MSKIFKWMIPVLLMVFVGVASADSPVTRIKVLLDWVPNTNHTGVYVAKDQGFYKQAGLEVEILQPSEGDSAALVAAGKAEFGFSYQEQVTYARTAANPLPIKAVAAIIQHNTSGFAAPVSKNIHSPKDFEGKVYGGWGSPMEETMLKVLMKKYRADFKKLRMVNIGSADFFASVQKDVDFSWIYYGWDGVAAAQKKFPISFIKLRDIDSRLDYYTPVLITSERTIKNRPELVKKFLLATAKGYRYAIDRPEAAARILVKQAPEIDRQLAVASQKYLAKEYLADSKRWGEMKLSTWLGYSRWMFENGLLPKKLDSQEAFTNEFLP